MFGLLQVHQCEYNHSLTQLSHTLVELISYSKFLIATYKYVMNIHAFLVFTRAFQSKSKGKFMQNPIRKPAFSVYSGQKLYLFHSPFYIFLMLKIDINSCLNSENKFSRKKTRENKFQSLKKLCKHK